MAIFHLSAKAVSRSTGRSAVAASAYRSGTSLLNARDGVRHDYARRHGVIASFIVAPDGADWAHDRSALWNAAEAAEKRKDAKVAREYVLALPDELDDAGRASVARLFAAEVVARYGVAADVAIHAPHPEGDQRNHHAHVLTTTRTVTAEGLGVKTRALDVASSASVEIEVLREVWGKLVNAALEERGTAERVEHRSFKRRGEPWRQPTVHVGVAASAMERRAVRQEQARERAAAEPARPVRVPVPGPVVITGAVVPARPSLAPVTQRGRRNAAVGQINQAIEQARLALMRAYVELHRLRERVAAFTRGLGRAAKEIHTHEQRREHRQQATERQQDAKAAGRDFER